MKVRWTRGSLRLRITPSELDTLTRGEPIRETLTFPGGLTWRVAALPVSDESRLLSDPSEAALCLSPSDLRRLAEPDREGVYFRPPDGPRFYMEKDFPCTHPRAEESGEPTSETFAGPAPEINGD